MSGKDIDWIPDFSGMTEKKIHPNPPFSKEGIKDVFVILIFLFAQAVVGAVDVDLPGGELGMGGNEARELVDFVSSALIAPYPCSELYRWDCGYIEFPREPFRVFDEGGDEGERELAVFKHHEVVAVPNVLRDHVHVVEVFVDVGVEALFVSGV